MIRETKPITINYIYFYHLQKCCIIPVYPDNISDGMSVDFNSSSALGRTASVYSYGGSGPRTFTVTLNLHRDLMMDLDFSDIGSVKDNVEPFWKDDYIDTLTKYIEASAYPVYKVYKNGSKAVIPPRVAIRFGDDIFLKGIISSSVNVQYGYPILTYDDGTKHYGKITLSFTLTETDPYDAEVIKQIGSFRGATAAFKEGIFRSKYETFDDADLSADSNLTSMTGDQNENNLKQKVISSISNYLGISTNTKKDDKCYFIYIYPWVEDYALNYSYEGGYWLGNVGKDLITSAKNHENVLEKFPNSLIMSDDTALTYLGWQKPTKFNVLGVEIMISTDWYAYIFNEDHWVLNEAYNRCLVGNNKKTPNDNEYSPKKPKQINTTNYEDINTSKDVWYYFAYVYHWVENYAADPQVENHGKFESYWLGVLNKFNLPENGKQLINIPNNSVKLSTEDAKKYLSWDVPDQSILSETQITTEDMWYVYIPSWNHMMVASEYRRCLSTNQKITPKYNKYTHPLIGGAGQTISQNYN